MPSLLSFSQPGKPVSVRISTVASPRKGLAAPAHSALIDPRKTSAIAKQTSLTAPVTARTVHRRARSLGQIQQSSPKQNPDDYLDGRRRVNNDNEGLQVHTILAPSITPPEILNMVNNNGNGSRSSSSNHLLHDVIANLEGAYAEGNVIQSIVSSLSDNIDRIDGVLPGNFKELAKKQQPQQSNQVGRNREGVVRPLLNRAFSDGSEQNQQKQSSSEEQQQSLPSRTPSIGSESSSAFVDPKRQNSNASNKSNKSAK